MFCHNIKEYRIFTLTRNHGSDHTWINYATVGLHEYFRIPDTSAHVEAAAFQQLKKMWSLMDGLLSKETQDIF